jgi:hypothetical protein
MGREGDVFDRGQNPKVPKKLKARTVLKALEIRQVMMLQKILK